MINTLGAHLPFALLGAMGYAFLGGVVAFTIFSQFTDNQWALALAWAAPAVAVATVFTSSTVAFYVVALTPFIIGTTLNIFAGLVQVALSPLDRRGYRGNIRKWAYELDPSDEFQAAMCLLDEEDINEVKKVSADADDFEQNIIEAAGLDDHELPDDW